MNRPSLRLALTWLPLTAALWACQSTDVPSQNQPIDRAAPAPTESAMHVQYLEIVTPDVDATCSSLAKTHGVSFGEPDAMLGGARTATLEDGGRLGVRAPMAEHETPTVRPYLLVSDIEAALSNAQEAGAEIAMPAMEIPGSGQFAIYILGGIQHGLWQL